MEKKIWLDMDGTFVDLYGVENWLEKLRAHDASPYKNAKGLINFSDFAKTIRKLQKQGWQVGIVSWTAKNSTREYDRKVKETKIQYLLDHFPSVYFDDVQILKYGTPKSTVGTGVLFDDELNNRNEWKGIACSQKNLVKKMKTLLTR